MTENIGAAIRRHCADRNMKLAAFARASNTPYWCIWKLANGGCLRPMAQEHLDNIRAALAAPTADRPEAA